MSQFALCPFHPFLSRSLPLSLSLSLSLSSRSNVQIRRKKDKRENPSRFTQKNWKRHAASNGLLYLLAKRSLAFLLFRKGRKDLAGMKKKCFPSSSRKPIEYTGSVWIDWRVASLNSRFKKYTRYSKIISRKDKKRSIEREERIKRRISIPRQSEIHGVQYY